MGPRAKGDTGVFDKPAEKKGAVSEQPIYGMAPSRFLLSAWVAVLFLSVYGIEALRNHAIKNESSDWVMEKIDGVAEFAETTGLAGMKDALNEFVEPLLNGKRYMKHVEPEEAVEVGLAEVSETKEVEDVEKAPLLHEKTPKPKRILIVGASSIQGHLGTALVKTFELYGGIKVKRFGKLSTGLVRPDQLNWPEKLEELAEGFKPDLIITNFGGNDAQGIKLERRKVARWGTKEWDHEYGERVKAIVAIGKKYKAVTINLGMPVMRGKKFSKRMERLNRVTREASDEVGAIYVSTWEMAANRYGEYRADISFEGERGLMRAGDGIHYSSLGARFVAEKVLQELERRFQFTPKGTELAAVTKHTVTSEIFGEKRHYLSFVPASASKENKLPVIILVHDYEAGWDYWSLRSHRALQRASSKHNVIFVSPDFGPELDLLSEGKVSKFLKDELIADMRFHLPVSDRIGLLGHRKGGYVSLALALQNPDLFSDAGALAAFSIKEGLALESLHERLKDAEALPRLYLSVGEEDTSYSEHSPAVDLLKAKGVDVVLQVHKRKLANRFSEEELMGPIRWFASTEP